MNSALLGVIASCLTVPRDPDFSDVGLLLHGDGVMGSTTHTDSGPYHHTQSAGTAAQISNTQVKWGTGSAQTGGGGWGVGAIVFDDHASLQASTENFTIEMWIYPTAVFGPQLLISKSIGTGFFPYQLYLDNDKLRFKGYDTGPVLAFDITGATTIANNTWYFVQARRNGGNVDITLNGVVDASGAITGGAGATLYSGAGTQMLIGDFYPLSSTPFIGFIDDFRFTKNVVRSATIPTAAFPDA